MKKLTFCSPLFTLLMVAVTFVSCRKHDPDVPDEDVAIGMMSSSVLGHSSTRAIINSLEDFQDQGTFGVFGYKHNATSTVANSSLLIFDNVEVSSYSGNGDTDPNTKESWEYSPLRYWDKTATRYYFGAYSPKLDDYTSSPTALSVSAETICSSVADGTNTTNITSLSFTIHNIPNWQLTGGVALNSTPTPYDLMVAHDNNTPLHYLTQEVDGENNVTRQAGYVNLSFSHILSMLKVYVSYPSMTDGYLYDYEVTEISIGDVDGQYPKTDGTSSYTLNYYDYDHNNPSPVTETAGSSSVIYNSTIGNGVSALKTPQLVCSYLVIPFSGTTANENLTLTVTYDEWKYDTAANKEAKIKTDGHATKTNTAVTSAIPLSPAVSAFEPGKIYEANIIFDKGKIVELTAVYVKDWQTALQGDHPLYNW